MEIQTASSFSPHNTSLYRTRRRRQNRACDQCRRSKRACDALSFIVDSRDQANNEGINYWPCSYCAKTNKRCTTVNADLHARSAWRLARQKDSLGISRQYTVAPQAQVQDVPDSMMSGIWDFYPRSDTVQALQSWTLTDLSGTSLPVNNTPFTASCGLDSTETSQPRSAIDLDGYNWSNSSTVVDPLPLAGIENNAELYDNGQLLDDFTSELQSHSFGEQKTCHYCEVAGVDCAISSALIGGHDCHESPLSAFDYGHHSCLTLDGRAASSNHGRSPPIHSCGELSPFSIHQKLSLSFHRQMTSSNLFKIYHDVLEHHLSCWLVEKTCPYRQSSASTSIAALAPEWETSWSNRILQRTIRLDTVAQDCKVINLTPSEHRAASNILRLAVLAFATQWAQGSARARRRYSNASQHSDESTTNPVEDFDRRLQQYFWTHTHRALQEAAQIDCYQVACAEIIFSLAQGPWHRVHQGRQERGSSPLGSIRSLIQSIIESDGPPIYAERAARRMHTLKVRCDSINKGFRSKNKHLSHGVAHMPPEDRDTIGLLYWLAIMFDTVAATMYERPVVVVDDECRYEIQKGLGSFGGRSSTEPHQWDYEALLRTGSEVTHRTHWPCSYDEAAEDVMMSGPVKVLLFRHVSYLQKALRQAAPNHQLEDILFNAALIYDYWNRSHGAFFQELVQSFQNVPQRLRGWFICISAHWHLAVLMLADLIEFIDDNSLGSECAKHERLATRMVARLREESTRELSELCAVATLPTYLDVPPESPEFHHALSDGTILTEPWTMMLISAFSKASLFFLEEAEKVRDAGGASLFVVDFKGKLEKADKCIKALWLLGKKSDMAWDLAETLQDAMSNMRCGFIRHTMSQDFLTARMSY